jgi:Ni,Fe-hydrogenase III large subunit
MSKARKRRWQNRQQYLARLAETNPRKFRREWAKRLESWSRLAHRRADLASAFDLVERVLDELTGCGHKAVKMEEADTKEVMTQACTKAVALVVDPRMYHLNSAKHNYRHMVLGLAKPPR